MSSPFTVIDRIMKPTAGFVACARTTRQSGRSQLAARTATRSAEAWCYISLDSVLSDGAKGARFECTECDPGGKPADSFAPSAQPAALPGDSALDPAGAAGRG